MNSAATNDADLVSATLAGNRDAFGHIVNRYQSLVCSLAYSATGSLGQSEDLAQETFITAWKHLSHLREREKLRAWLCGIARNRINNFLRREGREPVREAAPIDEAAENHSPEPLPVDHTISNEEAQILWRALARIPENYREPLVLFYREHQSIEAVAAQLELTEDAVKQRLSRGRKMLQEQVLAFVEGALERTNPGRAFTLGVLAALPLGISTSAKAATLAAAAAKGGGAKAAGALGIFGVLLSPLMVLVGNYLPYRMGLAEARTGQERAEVKKFFRRVLGWSLGLSVTLLAGLWLAFRNHVSGPVNFSDVFTAWFVTLVICYLLMIFVFTVSSTSKRRTYLRSQLALENGQTFPPAAFEYCTKIKFLGLPLVHIRIGDRFDLLRPPVIGWIAMGNFAVGGLFAFGGMAAAPFCIGGFALGVFALGGFAFGFGALGGLAFGGYALGGFVAGWQAVGGFAFGWQFAAGNIALAHDLALGRIAHGLAANNGMAEEFAKTCRFLSFADTVNRHLFWMNLLWITPLLVQWQLISRNRQRNHDASQPAGQN